MIEVLSIIGTFASILSIPLAVYFYLKTKDDKTRKVKSEIVSIILNHIGAGNSISISNVNSIIHSKLKEANLKWGKISRYEIMDAIQTEIISNPLLSKELKNNLLESSKQLYGFCNHLIDYTDGDNGSFDDDEDDIDGPVYHIRPIPKKYKKQRNKKSSINSESMRNAMSIIVLITAIITSIVYPIISSSRLQPGKPTLYYILIALFVVLSTLSVFIIYKQNK